jgi:hypothetical protein
VFPGARWPTEAAGLRGGHGAAPPRRALALPGPVRVTPPAPPGGAAPARSRGPPPPGRGD